MVGDDSVTAGPWSLPHPEQIGGTTQQHYASSRTRWWTSVQSTPGTRSPKRRGGTTRLRFRGRRKHQQGGADGPHPGASPPQGAATGRRTRTTSTLRARNAASGKCGLGYRPERHREGVRAVHKWAKTRGGPGSIAGASSGLVVLVSGSVALWPEPQCASRRRKPSGRVMPMSRQVALSLRRL